MDQHPIPRQITTFEFKLVGFMTLKQFLYLLIFVPIGFVLWKITPIPFLNVFLGFLAIAAGIACAFLPVNDRPLDVWVRNFLNRLTSPTQYTYHKHNSSLYFLQDLVFASDPHRTLAHIESKQKLAAYLTTTQPQTLPSQEKQQVQILLQNSPTPPPASSPLPPQLISQPVQPPASPVEASQSQPVKRPFFIGVVKNNKKIPLPGIMIYVKDTSGATIRLLKTNPHGVFATYNSLPSGEYIFEVKDPKGGYFFDTIKLAVAANNPTPFEFGSKELL